MKKAILALLVLTLLSVSALAGSVTDLDYKDKTCNGWNCNDQNREVNDYNVNVDADTVNGRDVTEEIDNLDHDLNHVEREVNHLDREVDRVQFQTNMNTFSIWNTNRKVNNVEERVDELGNVMASSSESWSTDKKGVGTSKMSKYLVGFEGLFNKYTTFMDYFKEWFNPFFEKTSYYERIVELEERNRLLLNHIQAQDERITALENN